MKNKKPLPGKHMTIVASLDPEKDDPKNRISYSVLINPASYTVDYSNAYSNIQALGSDYSKPVFSSIQPGTLAVDLLFDSTGSLGVATLNPVKGVMPQIQEFLNLVYAVDERCKKPRDLKVIWGPMALECVLNDLKITYNHFDPLGTPIRATGKCTFTLKKKSKEERDKLVAANKAEGQKDKKLVSLSKGMHFVNGLIKYGNYLDILAQQPNNTRPNALRGNVSTRIVLND